MAKRRRSVLKPLGDILHRVYPAPRQLRSSRIFAWWNRAVPERIVENARPVQLREGCLRVHVTSSVWAHELHYLADDLLARVQAFAPNAGVRELRFVVGPLPPRFKRGSKHKPKPTHPIELSEMPEELARALGRIRDDDVRETVAQAARAGLTRTNGTKQ